MKLANTDKCKSPVAKYIFYNKKFRKKKSPIPLSPTPFAFFFKFEPLKQIERFFGSRLET